MKKTFPTKKHKNFENKPTPAELAMLTLQPKVNAAAVIAEYASPFGKQEIPILIDSLENTIQQTMQEGMKPCQEMLISQANALQSIFMNLSLRAAQQNYIGNQETFLKLALKAQSQCRATLETLAILKNPPIVFAQQANIAQGNQQVNNNKTSSNIATTYVGKNNFEQNKLLEAKHEQRLEHRTTSTSGSYDTELAAVEKIHGAKDGGG